MSRFYGPGKSGQPKLGTTPKPPPIAPSAAPLLVLRFVLKSGAALELKEDSIDEVVGGWADKMCHAVVGIKVDGTKVLVPVASIDYMEEAQ